MVKYDLNKLYEEFSRFIAMKEKSETKIRKHYWLPCLLNEHIDWNNLKPEEYRKILKETKWLDRLTDAEYRYLFKPESMGKTYTYTVRSRLKKKIKEWLMVMSTVITFDPSVFAEALREAKADYEKQTGRKFPWGVPESK